MSQKPTAGGRTLLANTNKSVAPSTIVQARLPERKPSPQARLAGRCSIAILLLFAGLGVVFTMKHRSARPYEKTPAIPEIAIVANERPRGDGPSSFSTVAQPVPRRVQRQKPVAPTPLVVKQPEQLTHLPRTASEEPAVNEVGPEPMVSRIDKPLEPTSAPKDVPVPAENAGNAKPNNDAATKLAPTDVPAKIAPLQNFGTNIDFANDVGAAFAEAKKDKNALVVVVAYAGALQDGAFTSETAEQFRKNCLVKDEVADFLKNNSIVCVLQCVSGLAQSKDGMKAAGSVVSYVCRNDKAVLHAVSGPVDDAKFLSELRWAMNVRQEALQRGVKLYDAWFGKAHAERYLAAGDKKIDPKKGPDGFPLPPLGPMGFLVNVPAERPVDADPQQQIHWLLAKKPLPNFDHFSNTVYVHVLKEPIVRR